MLDVLVWVIYYVCAIANYHHIHLMDYLLNSICNSALCSLLIGEWLFHKAVIICSQMSRNYNFCETGPKSCSSLIIRCINSSFVKLTLNICAWTTYPSL
jgi:hypothetical protein